MDRDQNPSSAPKKSRFTPKAPRRTLKPSINPKIEADDTADGAANDERETLLQKVNERLGKRGSRNEKKSSVQVAFSNNVSSSGQIRSFGVQREGSNVKTNSSGSNSKTCAEDEKIDISSPSTALQDGTEDSDYAAELSDNKNKEYREPWDYNHSYYPTTLPLRPPYSGDPEVLNEREFGEAAMDFEYDENAINSALELGFLEENDEPQLLFLQLPTTLPTETLQEKGLAITHQKGKGKEKMGAFRPLVGASGKGKEKMSEFRSPGTGFGLKKDRGLENLSKEHVSKLLVYKSGAIKWKIGEAVYDVSPGVKCTFPQDIVAMNTDEKHACTLGEVGKRAVVTPDIDSYLHSRLNF